MSDVSDELERQLDEAKAQDDSAVRVKTYGDAPVSIGQRIGQLLAMGHSSVEIVATLVNEGHVDTVDKAQELVREVFSSWREMNDEIDLDMVDLKNWHIQLRHQLLVRTMDNNPRTALAILESLADIHRIKESVASNLDLIPIAINLVPRIDEPKVEKETEPKAGEESTT